ncbi:hypothetical protein LCGC14_0349610 [marine sediment metagenome]|uniref:Uncharacterized protein n=1 Tax=marine sediment metagenome TaxID=412755 RepID=A0A0F9TGP8_9ZZZZ
MKPAERDELLVRLDERTEAIKDTTERQEEHLEKMNGRLRDVENKQSRLKGILIGLGVLGSGGVGMGISQLLGG